MAADGQRFPAPGSAGHYDVEVLALLDAEAFEPPVAARLRGHVETCPECAATVRALDATRTALGRLAPPLLPSAVAARLDGALDAERRARFGVPVGSVGESGGPGESGGHGEPGGAGVRAEADTLGDLAAARRRRRAAARAGAWIAAAAVLLAGVGAGTAIITAGMDGSQQTALAPGDQTDAARSGDRAGSAGTAGPDLRSGGLGPDVNPSTGTGSDSSVDVGGPDTDRTSPTPNATLPTGSTLPHYSRGDLDASLAAIIAQATCDATGSCGGSAAGAMSNDELRTRCIAGLVGINGIRGDPKAVQFALFEGQQAFVFVFAGGQIVVVGPDCGRSTSPDVLFSEP